MRAPARHPAPAEMKTYVATPANRQRDWYVVDAEGKTLGRLATRIADILRGKLQARVHARTATPATSSWSSTPPRSG